MDLRALATDNGSKILLVVMDGLGGLADAEHGTELEEASTPNLDRLAAEGATGLLEPVGPGITPGSGPGHLALFGYDPMEFELGRGALSAAGLGFDLQPGDVVLAVSDPDDPETLKPLDQEVIIGQGDQWPLAKLWYDLAGNLVRAIVVTRGETLTYELAA